MANSSSRSPKIDKRQSLKATTATAAVDAINLQILRKSNKFSLAALRRKHIRRLACIRPKENEQKTLRFEWIWVCERIHAHAYKQSRRTCAHSSPARFGSLHLFSCLLLLFAENEMCKIEKDKSFGVVLRFGVARPSIGCARTLRVSFLLRHFEAKIVMKKKENRRCLCVSLAVNSPNIWIVFTMVSLSIVRHRNRTIRDKSEPRRIDLDFVHFRIH